MPAFKLAAGGTDNLRDTIAAALRQTQATAAYIEQLDRQSSVTQAALLHNAQAEGHLTAALRQADNLRELMRLANGGKPREGVPR